MTAKEAQLTELLSLTARTLTHLTASMTAMSFELLNSHDSAVHAAANKMIERMLAINTELDQQWQLIGDLAGVNLEPTSALEQVELQALESVSDEP